MDDQQATSRPVVFTIITVVFNGEADLPGTMESVRRQTYPHIEYIFVDGASRDNSLKIIQDFAPTMSNVRWISEPDKGLYDAMNKGMRIATGDFVWCLNCGDHIHEPDVLEKMAALVTPETDVLYGETMLVHLAATDFNRYGFDMAFQMTDKATGREVARGKQGVVLIGLADKKTSPLPEAFRQRLLARSAPEK